MNDFYGPGDADCAACQADVPMSAIPDIAERKQSLTSRIPGWWAHAYDKVALNGIVAGHLWTLSKGNPPDPEWYEREIDEILDHLESL